MRKNFIKWLANLPKVVEIEEEKRNKRLFGAFVTFASGRKTYFALRHHEEIYRDRLGSIAEAMRCKRAMWAIDNETILRCKRMGVSSVAVIDMEYHDIYVTTLDKFFDKAKTRYMNYESKGGALQRFVRLEEFKVSRGDVRIAV